MTFEQLKLATGNENTAKLTAAAGLFFIGFFGYSIGLNLFTFLLTILAPVWGLAAESQLATRSLGALVIPLVFLVPAGRGALVATCIRANRTLTEWGLCFAVFGFFALAIGSAASRYLGDAVSVEVDQAARGLWWGVLFLATLVARSWSPSPTNASKVVGIALLGLTIGDFLTAQLTGHGALLVNLGINATAFGLGYIGFRRFSAGLKRA